MEVQVTAEVRRFLLLNVGYGYGSGSGYGSGYGDGYGDGYGYGYGYGYGDGDGSGDGLKTLDGKAVHLIDGEQTIIDSVRGNYARGHLVGKDLSLQPCYIARVGDYFAHGGTLRQAQQDAQAKYESNAPLEERIVAFTKQYPTLDTVVTAEDLYRWHGILTGSCTMGRDKFCKEHGINMDDTMTVQHFVDLTKDSYGADAIRKLKRAYDNEDTD